MVTSVSLQEVNGIGFDSEDDTFIVTLFKNGELVCEYDIPMATAKKKLLKALSKIFDKEKPSGPTL